MRIKRLIIGMSLGVLLLGVAPTAKAEAKLERFEVKSTSELPKAKKKLWKHFKNNKPVAISWDKKTRKAVEYVEYRYAKQCGVDMDNCIKNHLGSYSLRLDNVIFEEKADLKDYKKKIYYVGKVVKKFNKFVDEKAPDGDPIQTADAIHEWASTYIKRVKDTGDSMNSTSGSGRRGEGDYWKKIYDTGVVSSELSNTMYDHDINPLKVILSASGKYRIRVFELKSSVKFTVCFLAKDTDGTQYWQAIGGDEICRSKGSKGYKKWTKYVPIPLRNQEEETPIQEAVPTDSPAYEWIPPEPVVVGQW